MPSHSAIQKWVLSDSFLVELESLLQPVSIAFSAVQVLEECYWPNKKDHKEKAISDAAICTWWKAHGGKHPTWDLLARAQMAHQNELLDTLILIEAKGHHAEMSSKGKDVPPASKAKKTANHTRIQAAIKEAETGWKHLDPNVCLSETEYYQLANRMAHAWKVAEQGKAVVLVFLGVLNDAPKGKNPFTSDTDWKASFHKHATHGTKTNVPDTVFERKWMVPSSADPTKQTPLWVLVRSLVKIDRDNCS